MGRKTGKEQHMNFRILRKDLKRKKSINLILLVFIFLSAMFIAGSLNNFTVIMNGVEHFMEQSEIGDFLIVTMGGSPGELSENDRTIEQFLENQEQVKNFTIDDNLFLSESQLKGKNGKKITLSSPVMLNHSEISQQKFFDRENREITRMEEGTIYLGQRMAAENKLKNGDMVTVSSDNGFEKEFQVAGVLKDAFMGSEMMGMERCIISRGDFQELLEESGLPYGRLYSLNCKDIGAFQEEYNRCEFYEMFGADRGTGGNHLCNGTGDSGSNLAGQLLPDCHFRNHAAIYHCIYCKRRL